MQRMAASFTEADLIRFFNSLSETEASLREAAHPRYMLEIGLVKLLEMRSVTSIEDILQKLDTLGFTAAPPARMSAASGQTAPPVPSATKEKKTLNAEPKGKSDDFSSPALIASPISAVAADSAMPPAHGETPKGVTLTSEDDVFEGHVEEMFEASVDLVEPDGMFTSPELEFRPEGRNDPPPVRLARLSSEELEHIEDDKLDNAYEQKLYFTGDNLFPIKNAERIVAFLAPQEPQRSASNGYGTAAAPAVDVSHMIADMQPEEADIPLPELGDDPTEDELLAYAKAHPAVRRVMRTFRAKIVKVEKR
jgi:hypothetical protein